MPALATVPRPAAGHRLRGSIFTPTIYQGSKQASGKLSIEDLTQCLQISRAVDIHPGFRDSKSQDVASLFQQ